MRDVATPAVDRLNREGVAQSGFGAPLIQLRWCTEADIPKVMRFIHQHWRAGHILSRDETLLRWQYSPPRAKTESFRGLTVVLALTNGEIGGMLGLIPFDLNLRGTTRRGAWLSQWICAPELRPCNVGLALLWQIHKLKYDALWGIGVSQAGARVTAGLGFQPLPAIPRWVGVFDPTGTQQLLRMVAPFAQPRDLAQALRPYVVQDPLLALGQASIRITPWADSLRESWDRFWIRCLAPGLVGPARDSSYLLWRYIGHPHFHYEIRVAQTVRTGEILGLSVFRVETVHGQSARVMRIVEFLASPLAHSALTTALVEAAREQDVIFADFYCTREDAGAALEAVGFRRHDDNDRTLSLPSRLQPLQPADSPLSGVAWLTKDLRQHLGNLAARTDLHITKSDSDQDRPN
jgi:hypothetical protein